MEGQHVPGPCGQLVRQVKIGGCGPGGGQRRGRGLQSGTGDGGEAGRHGCGPFWALGLTVPSGLPADHTGAAVPELAPGTVSLHQGPGDAQEPVPDHGQRLCECGVCGPGEWVGRGRPERPPWADGAGSTLCLKTRRRMTAGGRFPKASWGESGGSPHGDSRSASCPDTCRLPVHGTPRVCAVLDTFYRWGN